MQTPKETCEAHIHQRAAAVARKQGGTTMAGKLDCGEKQEFEKVSLGSVPQPNIGSEPKRTSGGEGSGSGKMSNY